MADDPIDTLEEVKKFGLNPRFVHSCGDPQERDVAGCAVAHLCDLPEKDHCGQRPPSDWDATKRNWDGPCNVGVRQLKYMTDGTVSMKQEIIRCHTFIHLRENLMDNGGSMDIIGREGDEIEITETVKVADASAEGGFRHDLKTDVKKVIPRHPKLRDLPQYRNRVTLMDRQKARDESEKRDRGARMLGIEPEEAGARKEAQPSGSGAGVPRK